MEMQKCTICGADDRNSKCCEESSKLTADKGSTDVSSYACPKCNTVQHTQKAKFCFECGHSLQGKIAAGVEPNGQKETKEAELGKSTASLILIDGSNGVTSKRKTDGEEIECNAKKTKNDVAAESSPVHSGQQSYSVSSPELTINNKHGIHTVKDVNISTQECVEGKQRGNDDQRNGKQILSHNEALGTASVDSGDSSSTQQSIGGSVTAFSEVTSKTEQGSDAAEDMIAPIHESMTITKEGKETEGSAEKAKNDDMALETSSVDSGDNSSAQQSNGVTVPACSKVASNVESGKDTAEDAKTSRRDFVKSNAKGEESQISAMEDKKDDNSQGNTRIDSGSNPSTQKSNDVSRPASSRVTIEVKPGKDPIRDTEAATPDCVMSSKAGVNMKHHRGPVENIDDSQAMDDQARADLGKKKTNLELAESHPLKADDPAVIDSEMATVEGNSASSKIASVGNEMGKDTEVDKESVECEDDDGSDSDDDDDDDDSDDNDASDTPSAHDTKDASTGKKPVKKKGKTKEDRRRKKDRKDRRVESKRKDKETGVETDDKRKVGRKGEKVESEIQNKEIDIDTALRKMDISSSEARRVSSIQKKESNQIITRSRTGSLKDSRRPKTGQDASTEPQDKESNCTSKQERRHSSRPRNAKTSDSQLLEGSGDPNELRVDFYALLDPAFSNAERMFMVMGYPIGDWLKGPLVPLEPVGKCEEFEVLHGVIFLSSVFKERDFSMEYKYVQLCEEKPIYEVIRRPVISRQDQGFLNRKLSLGAKDWTGVFWKFDNIVAPPNEQPSFFAKVRQYIPWRSPTSAELSEVQEFTLCLRAFLPARDFQSFQMDARNSFIRVLITKLCQMEFSRSNHYTPKLFCHFSFEDNFKIFINVFNNEIEENCSIVAEGDPRGLKYVILSTVTLARILLFFLGKSTPWKKCLKLINCFSLTHLQRRGTTSEEIKQIFSEQLLAETSIKLMKEELTEALDSILLQNEVTKQTSAWWSIVGLISILNDQMGEENQFGDVEKRLTRLSFSGKEKDITEVDAALYYAPCLQQILLSMFCLENYEAFLKIGGLDCLMLFQETKKTIKRAYMTTDRITKLESLFQILKSKLEQYEQMDIDKVHLGITTTSHLFASCLPSIDCIDAISFYGELIGFLDIFVSKAAKIVFENPSAMERVIATFEKAVKAMLCGFKGYWKNIFLIKHCNGAFEVLDLFFKVHLTLDRLRKIMDDSVENALNYVFSIGMDYESSKEKLLEVLCSSDASNRSPRMLTIFDSILDAMIDNSNDYLFLFDHLSKNVNSKLWRLFDKVLPDVSSELTVLKTLLEWPRTTNFIKLTAKLSKKSQKNDTGKLLIAEKCFQTYEMKLINGSITSRELEIIRASLKKFYQISLAIKNHLSGSEVDGNEKILSQAIEERAEECKFVKLQREKVEVLKTYLSRFSEGILGGEVQKIEYTLRRNWYDMPLSKLCCREKGVLKDLWFNLPEPVQNELERMCFAFSSSIFCKMWKQSVLKDGENREIEMAGIVECLFQPALSKTITVLKSLFDQSITLRKLTKVFEDFKAEKTPERILKELRILIPLSFKDDSSMSEYKDKAIKSTAKKIYNFFKLQANQRKATNIIKLAENLKLEGNFDIFEEIENQAGIYAYEVQLKSLHDEHFAVVNSLQHVTDEMNQGINCILHCMNLIMWLREELKDLREVKTFVDLLSISAGESDFEADRVSCLHTVCLEFEPIVFKLEVESGPVELINCCKMVMGKAAKDPSLFDKLVDCNRLLEWFKNERESYGSVATSSMKEAEAVNRRGCYVIGSLERFDVEQSVVTMENSLYLFVPEKENGSAPNVEDSEYPSSSKENVKVYKLNEIGDLQSKLMLIGGQEGKEREFGQIEKDCFLQMFEAVTRIAVLYIQLCESGCIKYLAWKSTFHCNLNDGLDAFRSTIASVEEECSRLENDLREWKTELDMKRTQFPHLNYFTVRQLLTLQTNLKYVILNENLTALRDLPAQIFSLLDEVFPDIDEETFQRILLKSSHQRHYGETKYSDDSWMQIESNDDKFVGISLNEIEDFITSLEEEGHDEDVAKAATMQCGLLDRSKTSVWAYTNCESEELIEDLAKQMDEVLEAKEKDDSKGYSAAMIDSEVTGSGISADERSSDMEYLTLEDLGKVLDELAKERRKRRRKLRPVETMNKERPNLMIVPRDDLLIVIIEIYRQASDSLPASGEVEICNHNTTLERVELLFRRALNDPNGIYTLAFIDQLDYNVAVQAFEKLQLLLRERPSRDVSSTQVKDSDAYNLVLMCSSEREDGSFLASAWDEYRIVSHRCPPREDAKEFLTQQLMVDSFRINSKYVNAASADKERSTVRVIKSRTAGTGKSLLTASIGEELESLIRKSPVASKQVNSSVDTEVIVTASLQGTMIDKDSVVKELIPYDKKKKNAFPRIYHFDIASTVTSNLDSFLFQLLIIGSISNSTGSIWKKKPTDLYIIEITEPLIQSDPDADKKKRVKTNTGNVIPLLPTTECITPLETLEALNNNTWMFPGFDEREFKSEAYQRVYHCLELLEEKPKGFGVTTFQSGSNRSDRGCLEILLKYCGVKNPSWREIKHFVHFFNNQLLDCENSVFCNPLHVGDSLPGFKSFVVKFMLQMSKDFATPSISEESEQEHDGLVILRRRWEKSEHPYLFFNQDHVSMSFLGFTVNAYGDLMDKENKKLITRGIMTNQLYQGLKLNGVDLFTQHESWNRSQKLTLLCQVMGIEIVYDPDCTYELTIDNMMKILAIHMRFRSGIPVIIMGETGCGKTHLIRFMCSLKAGPGGPQNMILVKVHGGVTEDDIKKKVDGAIKLAQENRARHRSLETVLFFDEANTTSAIGLIKEIMCDRRMAGKPLSLESCGLKIIAACNPYRKHTDEMIDKLESAGLGYHVKSEDASEKLGNIPLRQLVYRVHKLPESMLPLVWDFGQLSNETEVLYAAQIVHRYARENKIPDDSEFLDIVVRALAASQVVMRQQKDECSFVSLRDVERGVQVLAWFYSKMDLFYPLIEKTKDSFRNPDDVSDDEELDEEDEYESLDEEEEDREEEIKKIKLSLIFALGVCYAARLEKRNRYYKRVAAEFTGKYQLEDGYQQIKDETYFCQQMFLDQLQLGDNIAKNTALSENVFMMVVCIELRIPLFVIGKPGSSKSLAKTIIQDNMQGALSHSDIFKKFKQILMCSYQCSPLSTADGIIGVFRQCSRFQEGKDLNEFTSVVVLDEVGLAEDSPRMPLKALHPLLEDGTDGSEDLTLEGTDLKSKRVAFIGISNWALDPAKMNRGLMLTRGQPNTKELISSAEGICNSNQFIKRTISQLFPHLAAAYSKIYKEQRNCENLKKSKKEEFFGLRDYYSLIKMIFNKAIAAKRLPTLNEMEHAVKRNFGGLEDFNTWNYFYEELKNIYYEVGNEEADGKLDVSPVGLLKSCLQKENSKKDTRYVLLMTENYAALRVLEKKFPEEYAASSVIFGSSFPKDQEFTQICRDINKIKVCMETGMTVILLNMENLYESLYDALNQYYVYLGGQRYVDLGLGTHRVKCRVHENFRLIVVAEKSTVYDSFPIPLINRLEKHFLVMSTSLTDWQSQLCSMIGKWAKEVSERKFSTKQYSLGDCFVGYNADTPAAVLLETLHDLDDNANDELIVDQSKRRLLEVATPEAVARLQKEAFGSEADMIWDIYFKEQNHDSLESLLQAMLIERKVEAAVNIQVTTFSRLLSPHDQTSLENTLGSPFNIKCISLNQFQTEQQFSDELRRYIKEDIDQEKVLILQCDNGDESSDLIASARHLCHQSKLIYGDERGNPLHIIFIINLKRVARGCQKLGSFHGVNWRCVHIDELRPSSDALPSLIPYANHKMSYIFERFGGRDTSFQDEEETIDAEPSLGISEGAIEVRNDDETMDIESHIDSVDREAREQKDNETQMEVDNEVNSINEEQSTAPPLALMEVDTKASLSDKHGPSLRPSPAINREETRENERKLLLGILRRCVQSSVVQTVAGDEQGKRLTKRIHLLMELFSPHFPDPRFSYRFTTVLLRVIYRNFLEKESQALEEQKWFHDEAASGKNIQDCGTFRRALSYRIEKEVIPVLSHVISQVDVNSNLDLLTENDEWKRALWLEFFASEEFLHLDQLSTVKLEPMKRKKTDVSLVCWFPFSSAIRNKMTSIIQTHLKDDESDNGYKIVRDTMLQTYTGRILLELTPRQLRSYMHDLIFLEYDVNDNEHEVISISILSRAMRKRNKQGEVEMDIVDIHMIINGSAFRKRIQCFLSMLALMGDDIANLKRIISDSDDIVLDAVTLRSVLTKLQPTIEDILDPQSRFNWTARVQEIKLVANQLLSLPENYSDEFSDKAKKILSDARIFWTRIQLLKIFIEHVCPPGISCSQADITAALKFHEKLQLIEDEIASEKTWVDVDNTLQSLDADMKVAYECYNTQECGFCNNELHGPIQLPCHHIACFDCAKRLLESSDKKCSLCQAAIPNDFEITEDKKGEILFELGSFRERCMSFFMEAVSTFLFSSANSNINEDVIKLMMSYITAQDYNTKEMTPFYDYKVDATPTIRSFLVQQLLKIKAHRQMTRDALQQYLDESSSRDDDEESRLELCLLLVHCLEDFKMADVSKISRTDSQLERLCGMIGDLSQVEMVVSNIEALEKIACIRVFISKAAEFAYHDIIEKASKSEFRGKLKELYSLLMSTCMNAESRNLQDFFLRQFIRNYGPSRLQKLIASEAFHWLGTEEENKAHSELPDRFAIYEDRYKVLREKIGEAVVIGKADELCSALEDEGVLGRQGEAFALLALYREVTTLYLKQPPDLSVCGSILDCLMSKGIIANQEKLGRQLIENKQGNGFEMLTFSPQLEQQHFEVAEIVIHAFIVLLLNQDNLLLQPLALLVKNPRDMINSYLPTMPSDNFEGVFDAGSGIWKCYECPNGHPYVITECGQPYEQYNCPECNAVIGGMNHVLQAGNTAAQRVDRTRTGYILGDPRKRIDFPIAERNLQPPSHSLLSVLFHAALLLGACSDENAVADMINPQLAVPNVQMFVWEHLQISIKIFAKSIGRSLEDAIVLVHLVLKNMLQEENVDFNENFGSLSSKECRRSWEEKFNIRLLIPFLSNVVRELEPAQERIVNDRRLGSNSLLKRLYEKDITEDEIDLDQHAFEFVRFWRYRIPITVSHLRCSLQEFIAGKGESTCQVLQKFLEKVEVLNLIKNLPDIVRLQYILSRRLNGQLSSEAAKTESVKAVMSGHFIGAERREIEKLLKVYYATWRALKPTLHSYGGLSQVGDLELTRNSPIGYFIPSTKDHGKLALSLVNCLAEAHNEIVAERRKVQGDKTNIKSIPTQEATVHHLVAYDHDIDLIPMLYAHCSYSLEIGKGTVIDYNFLTLERQLVTTFISGKPMLEVKILTMKYADDINSLLKFEELEKRIEQRQIPYMDQFQMTKEFHDIAQVCDALRAVEIALSLLSSTGADANYFYKKYLEDIRMDPKTCLVSGKMQSVCRVTHVRSIWSMLSVERAYRLYVNGQDPFDIKDMFRHDIRNFDEQVLRSMDTEHLFAELTEYIILEVPLRTENDVDFPLQESLMYFEDRKKSTKSIKGLGKLPDSLCLEHIYSLWKIVADARKIIKTG